MVSDKAVFGEAITFSLVFIRFTLPYKLTLLLLIRVCDPDKGGHNEWNSLFSKKEPHDAK